MTFTIEQLEALKENTTPGKWEINPLSGNVASFGHGEIAGTLSCPSDRELIMAAPDLVDALIAEKRAHAKLRAEIEALIRDCVSSAETFEHNAMTAYSPEACESASTVERDTAEILTRILEGNA